MARHRDAGRQHARRPARLTNPTFKFRPASLVAIASVAFVFAGHGFASGPARAPFPSVRPPGVEIVETNNSDHRLTQLPYIPFSSRRDPLARAQTVVHVNPDIRYQQFNGVGGAMTNTASYLLLGRLPFRAGKQVIQDVFGPEGMNADFTRVPIGGSDFNQNGVAYSDDDMPPGKSDPGLVHFSLAHDRNTIAALRLALAAHPGLRILACPWSPPAWMKTNRNLNNSMGHGYLDPSDYGVYARYLTKWVLAVARAGLPIDALGVQNEPNVWTNYPGGDFTARQEGSFIRYHLRPDLRRAGLTTRIYVTDASWDFEHWTERAIPAARGAAGVFWHCYTMSPVVMTQLHRRYPTEDQIVDECALNLIHEPASQLVIESARNWASGVNFWNLVLNPQGGPKTPNDTHCGGCVGSVTANIAADTSTLSQDGDTVATVNPKSRRVSYNREFYEMGQTDRFIEPGARRIYSSHSVRYDFSSAIETSGVDNVAFRNPDGSLVLEAFNNTYTPKAVGVRAGESSFIFTIPGRATDTLRWNEPLETP